MAVVNRRLAAFLGPLILLVSRPALAQERPLTLFAETGFASIGHADSEQGKAPIFGGGASFQLTPWLVAEADLHGARVTRVFGDDDHVFNEVAFTGSLLYRWLTGRRARVVAGGGLAAQRAHSEFNVFPVGRVDRTETIRLLHGRGGVEWDASDRVVIRTDAALWFGPGLDWVLGGRFGIGYRF
jgi:hypothetical protein